MSLNINQFAMSVVKGQTDLHPSINIITAQVDSTSAGGLVAGQPVKLVAHPGAQVPSVVECAADSDDVYGFIVYNIKNKSFKAYDAVEIATMDDVIMYMEASAAITQGAKVAIVLAGQKIVTATTGQRIVGIAFDGAAASGALIRVRIILPGVLA